MPKTEIFNRVDVLDKAAKIFSNKGFNGTSMQDLVDTTGLNRSSIYNSFGSKLDLFLECLMRYETNYQNEVTDLLMKSNSSIEIIQTMLVNVVNDSLYDTEHKGCLIGNCRTEMGNQNKKIDNFLLRNQTGTLALLERIIETGQSEGSINKRKKASDYALFIYSNIQGLRSVGIFINNPTELNALVKTVMEGLE